VWEVVHKGSGYAAVILSVAAMFEGLEVIEPTASSTVVDLYTAWFSITVFCFLVAQSECRKAARKRTILDSAVPELPLPVAPSQAEPVTEPGAVPITVTVPSSNLNSSTQESAATQTGTQAGSEPPLALDDRSTLTMIVPVPVNTDSDLELEASG
jgi:hypothetical protein